MKVYHLIDKNGNSYDSKSPGTLGEHWKLKIYGRLDCSSALRYIAKRRLCNIGYSSQMKKPQLRLVTGHAPGERWRDIRDGRKCMVLATGEDSCSCF